MQPTMDEQDAARSGLAVKARVEKNRGGPTRNGANNLASAITATAVSQTEDEAVRAQIKELSAYFRRSYHLLYGQALGLVASPEVAEDVVQEAFTNTSERIEAGTRIENMNSWLRCCVQNISIKHLRRKPTLPLQEELEIGGYTLPADLAHTRQRFADVCHAIDRLAPAQKSAFILAEIRGMAHRDIADAMDRSEGSVRQLISRARNRIREANGRRELSVVLPLLITADAEACGGISFLARAKIARSRLLTGLNGIQAYLRQPLRTLGKPVRIAAVLATSSAVVIVLGGSPTDDAVLTGSVERGSSSASSFSSEARAGLLEAGQDASAISSSNIPTIGGTSMNSPDVSNKFNDSLLGRHSEGSHQSGGTNSLSKGRQDPSESTAQEPVASIAAPNTGEEMTTPYEGGIVAPFNTTPPSISGDPYVGKTLALSHGTWGGTKPSVSYQWRRNGTTIPGATGSTYALIASDGGSEVSVVETATNAADSATATSSSVSVIDVPQYTTQPTVTVMSGNPPAVGEVLFCSEGVWTYNPFSIVRKLRRNGHTIVPNTFQYTLVAIDIGSNFDCYVTATNAAGTAIGISDTLTTP